MGSTETTRPAFVEALKQAAPSLRNRTQHEVASWIVGRLNYLTASALALEGEEFANDTDDFGYKLKVSDREGRSLAHGAIVIHADRVYFASVSPHLPNFQEIVVELLASHPDDLSPCEITAYHPDVGQRRHYGYDGRELLR